MNLTNISEIRPILEENGFSFSKSLGQNFLINKDIPIKIADNAVLDSDTSVLEIGPGVGCLTACLAQKAKKVVAVEIDNRLLPVLDKTLAEYDNIEIINADILKTDIKALCEEHNISAVCANLPYYITTPVLMYLLESGAPLKSITVMVQKEVAHRLTAKPGGKEYGAVSVAVAYRTSPKILFDVSAGSFMPAPKVCSTVIRLDVLEEKVSVADEGLMFRLVKAGFSQRRKTLANALCDCIKLPKSEIISIISGAGFSADIRAERLSAADFAHLSDKIKEAL